MKASRPPETIPGTSSGRVTLPNSRRPDAPRSLAASNTAGSSSANRARIGSRANGMQKAV